MDPFYLILSALVFVILFIWVSMDRMDKNFIKLSNQISQMSQMPQMPRVIVPTIPTAPTSTTQPKSFVRNL